MAAKKSLPKPKTEPIVDGLNTDIEFVPDGFIMPTREIVERASLLMKRRGENGTFEEMVTAYCSNGEIPRTNDEWESFINGLER